MNALGISILAASLRLASSGGELINDANSWNSSSDWRLHQLHGAFMSLAWFGVIPWSVFIARYLRNLYPKGWFQAHRAAMLIAVLFIACSLGLIAYASGGFNTGPHTLCGIFSISLMFLQPLVAFIRPKATLPDGRPHPHRWIFNWGHRAIAFSAGILAVASVFLGTNMLGTYGLPSTMAAPICFFILLAIVFFIAEAAHQGYIMFPRRLLYENMKSPIKDESSRDESSDSAEELESSYRRRRAKRSSSFVVKGKARKFWLSLLTLWILICLSVTVAMVVCILLTPVRNA